MDVKSLICTRDKTLREVIDSINYTGKGLAFIVDEGGKFIRTLSDGDIRKVLLAGCDLNTRSGDLFVESSDARKKADDYYKGTKFEGFLARKSVTASRETPVDELMKSVDKRIWIIPLLDENGRAFDFFEYKLRTHWPISSTHFKGNELNYVLECIQTNWISSQGRFIEKFEESFSGFCNRKYGIAVSNGTTALHLAMIALGIGPGDEVILPDLTFPACINTILFTGAIPVMVDVNLDDWCIDPDKILPAITDKTKAIMPVHLYGQPCNMDEIMKIASDRKLYIIEDGAEAHGAYYKGKVIGGFGDISCFSFFGNKIITTGEGGMCLTDDPGMYEKMRIIRDHGMNKNRRYWHDHIGYNFRMTNMQAAIGVAQLEEIQELLSKRFRIRATYNKYLEGLPYLTPQNEIPGRKSVPWLVSYLYENRVEAGREEFIQRAKGEGIDIRPFFFPLGSMPPYTQYKRFETPVCLELSKKGFCLPTFPSLREEECKIISQKVTEILDALND